MLFVKKNLRKLVFSIRKECNCTTNDEVITQASATKAILITQHVTPSLTCSISLMKSDILYSTKTPRSHFDIFFAKPVFIKSYPLYKTFQKTLNRFADLFIFRSEKVGSKRESNPRPPAYESSVIAIGSP